MFQINNHLEYYKILFLQYRRNFRQTKTIIMENILVNSLSNVQSFDPHRYPRGQQPYYQFEQPSSIQPLPINIHKFFNEHQGSGQFQQSRLEIDHNYTQDTQLPRLPAVNKVFHDQKAIPDEGNQPYGLDQQGPQFERTKPPPPYKPLIINQLSPKRLMNANGLSKSGTNIKNSRIMYKTKSIINIQKVNTHAQSKISAKQNKFLKKKVKQKHSYDQLMDKNLIQYLYTRQNKIFEEEEPFQGQKPDKQPPTDQSRTTMRKCPTYKLGNRLKLIKREGMPFEIRMDCKNTKCNIFDAISCEQSRRLNEKPHQYETMRRGEQAQLFGKQEKAGLQILKKRMTKLQETVYHKVTFLVEMGVKFKCK